jgi:hypothetical protein
LIIRENIVSDRLFRLGITCSWLLVLAACDKAIGDVMFVDAKRDLAERRTFIEIALNKADYTKIEDSGEALLLNIYPCGGNEAKAVGFPLQTREAASYGQGRVLVRLVVSANPSIQDNLAQHCARLTTSGYSLSSFESAPFRLR